METASGGRRVTVGLVLLLGSMTALGPLTIDTYLPALPQMATDLGASESQIQLTLTTMLLGLGLGQLINGPLSDTVGRRLPIIVGFSGHIVASLLIALSPSVELVIGLRLLQGFFGSAVMVVAMAVVRDLFEGLQVVQMLSRLSLVMGLAPILAPSLGGLLLAVTSWHGIFVFLALAAGVALTTAVTRLPETLPPERRLQAGLGPTLQAYRTLLSDRAYLVMVVVGAANSVSLFSYISGSSFIFQEGFGLSPQQYALVFGANGVLLIGGTQLTPVLVRRFGAERVLLGALVVSVLASVATVVLARTDAGLLGAVIPIGVVMAMLGLCMPTTTTLALEHHGRTAGTAMAVLGAGRFAIAGGAAPLVGLLGDGTAGALGLVMVVSNALAAALMIQVVRHRRR
ncbi:multidrug effflux MFS transporter [Auraticoccus monumenti]|uniref:MFS transporter, DHA1 family, bicyclomycin/chloramphenicol resistance protein n=1 Tax=Auraticoccus monumenti TaxID=675864 RepID=A0A1G7E0Z5_9ACTN|nr:multidrug effflux MFS transporter [Auraticoccus monumenti]SDE57369.1 MFS transporter, DHA1 family, bicyclomycin/chloramphenicol resistance protein [Auraticoccus monumenti]